MSSDSIWINDPLLFPGNEICSRKYVLLPEIAAEIEKFGAKTILDFGCGEGYLANLLNSKEAQIGLFDISPDMTLMAERSFIDMGFKSVTTYSATNHIPRNSWDCVVLSMVLMTLQSHEEHATVLENTTEAMKDEGILLIGISHPCFRPAVFGNFHTDYSLGREFKYMADFDPFEVYLRTSKQVEPLRFTDFHQSLSYTFKSLNSAGLVVEELQELNDFASDGSYYNPYLPPYILMKCSKRR